MEKRELTSEQIKEIKENFQFFDRDNNGQIDADEFTMLLQVLSPNTTRESALQGFDIVDENNDGHIDVDEFIAWWQRCWWEY